MTLLVPFLEGPLTTPTLRGAVQLLLHLRLVKTQGGGPCAHFTEEETEAQRLCGESRATRLLEGREEPGLKRVER